jgi:hypothetical protein
MLRKISLVALALIAVAFVAVLGCSRGTDKPGVNADKEAEVKAPVPGKDGEHGHKPGTHGGNIVEIGRDNYHAEVVFEKGGAVRLYLLGKDEDRVQEVETQTLTAYAKPAGSTESLPFKIKPTPTEHDTRGKTSQFAGTLPKELWGKPVEVTVPSIRIAGERFRFFFKSSTQSAHVAMPPRATSAKARALYLTPGGKYTTADIKANGNMTAEQKYGGKMSEHDMDPQPGDKICPITATKANPEFTWVVGGKTYEFCCPPCIDEFVKKAKQRPQKIKEPGAYVKRGPAER